MNSAASFDTPVDGVSVWSEYDPETKVDLSCSAVATPLGLVLIDPILLAGEALAQIAARSAPIAILLTNGNHERASHELAARFGIEIWAPAGARGELEADFWFVGGQPLPGGARAVPLPGFGPAETAYQFASRDLLVLGDAVINLDSTGLALLPDKYCEDPAAAREAIRTLESVAFDHAVFAHGEPLIGGAAARLSRLWAG